jgi:hypothetical protein
VPHVDFIGGSVVELAKISGPDVEFHASRLVPVDRKV